MSLNSCALAHYSLVEGWVIEGGDEHRSACTTALASNLALYLFDEHRHNQLLSAPVGFPFCITASVVLSRNVCSRASWRSSHRQGTETEVLARGRAESEMQGAVGDD